MQQPPADAVRFPVRGVLAVRLVLGAGLRAGTGAGARVLSPRQQALGLRQVLAVLGRLVVQLQVVVLAGDDDLWQTVALVHLQRNVGGLAAPSVLDILEVQMGPTGGVEGRAAGRHGDVGEGGDPLLESVSSSVPAFALMVPVFVRCVLFTTP